MVPSSRASRSTGCGVAVPVNGDSTMLASFTVTFAVFVTAKLYVIFGPCRHRSPSDRSSDFMTINTERVQVL
jgi:hypothetical protein